MTFKEMGMKINFNFDNSYANKLQDFYVPFIGDLAPNPVLIKFNHALADDLGIDFSNLKTQEIAQILSGGVEISGASPLAQVYAGHQFGGFSPRLGDGRALLLGEVLAPNGIRHDIHLKGSGRTVYSRGGDGKAALAPVLREYILGEAMHALGVPTTRALAAISTGENVYRDSLLPGAVLARTASSHIRVGTFQYFAAQGDYDKVKQLADYTIDRHFTDLKNKPNSYLKLLEMVCERQAQLLSKWMQIGFVHGVMNTDNMTISGETIDYGPCAFIDHYDASAVFSSIDHQGRYAFGNQVSMAQWNLARLAETLLPLIDEDPEESIRLATKAIQSFTETYEKIWLKGMCEKVGLTDVLAVDMAMIQQLLKLMQTEKIDFTIMFRALAGAVFNVEGKGKGEGGGADAALRTQFHKSPEFDEWLALWQQRGLKEQLKPEARAELMNSVNPIYIPRNHLVEAALQAAEKNSDFEPFETLMKVLEKPFEKRPELEAYEKPAPIEFGHYKTFCGT
jgi:uncharacterized protein YdiU (UPF0061 family)